MTENLRDFIKENKSSLVIEGEHLTPDGGRIHNKVDMEQSDRTRYKLENGKVFTLTCEDKNDNEYNPQWKI